jgi:NitT/TauT family transport system substrate-binding protein
MFGRAKFHDANPKTVGAIIAAVNEASDLIAKDPKAAAEIYLSATKERFTPDEIVEMLGQPNVVFSSTPQGVMKLVAFMARTGLVKQAPAGWKDLFFPELHGRPGS